MAEACAASCTTVAIADDVGLQQVSNVGTFTSNDGDDRDCY